MSTPLTLTLFAAACLIASAYLARRHLRVRRGLRTLFVGLFVAAIGGVAVAFSSSLWVARVFSVPMLVGIGLVIWGIRFEKTRGHDAA